MSLAQASLSLAQDYQSLAKPYQSVSGLLMSSLGLTLPSPDLSEPGLALPEFGQAHSEPGLGLQMLMDGWMYGQISPRVLQDFIPFGSAALFTSKADSWKCQTRARVPLTTSSLWVTGSISV